MNVKMKGIKSKNDYQYLGERKTITTTINKKLYKQWKQLSNEIEQPTSKMYDVLLMEILNDTDKLNDFINKVKQY